MKKLTALTLTFLAFSNLFAKEVLVETNNPDNIRLNGRSFNYCAIISEDGETEIDNKKAKFISIVIGNKEDKQQGMSKIRLFRVDENGDIVRRWYYPDSDKVANNLSQRAIDYGYKFEANDKKISFTNGSSCMDREEFTLIMKDNDFTKIKKIQWNQGMCNTGQILLAVPAAIFGADTHGNDLKCKF